MKTFLILCMITTVMLVCGCNSNEQTDVAKPKSYTLVYSVLENWDCEIWLNGNPVINGESGSGSIPISQFVIDAQNTVSVTAKQISAEIPEPLVVQIWSSSGDGSNYEQVFEVRIGPRHAGYTVNDKKYEFDAKVPFEWAWQEGALIDELSSKEKEGILAELQVFYDALKSKDLERTKQLMGVAIVDTARSHGEDYSRKILSDFEDSFSDPNFAPHILKHDDMLIEVGGQIVLVSGNRGGRLNTKQEVIKLTHSEESGSMSHIERGVMITQIGFSKIDGEWKIVLVE